MMQGIGAAAGMPPAAEEEMMAPQAGPPAPPAQPGGIEGATGDQKPATPEQQAEYNKFVATGVLMLYDDKFVKTAKGILSSASNVVDAMARIGAGIASRIFIGSKEKGKEIDPAVVLHGGWELMHEVKEFAVAAGSPEVTDDDVEMAYYMAADMFRSTLDGAGILDKDAQAGDFEQIRAKYGDDTFRALAERLKSQQGKTQQAMSPQGNTQQAMPPQPGAEQ